MAAECSPVEGRGAAVVVSRVDLGSVLDEELDGVWVAALGRPVEGCDAGAGVLGVDLGVQVEESQ